MAEGRDEDALGRDGPEGLGRGLSEGEKKKTHTIKSDDLFNEKSEALGAVCWCSCCLFTAGGAVIGG